MKRAIATLPLVLFAAAGGCFRSGDGPGAGTTGGLASGGTGGIQASSGGLATGGTGGIQAPGGGLATGGTAGPQPSSGGSSGGGMSSGGLATGGVGGSQPQTGGASSGGTSSGGSAIGGSSSGGLATAGTAGSPTSGGGDASGGAGATGGATEGGAGGSAASQAGSASDGGDAGSPDAGGPEQLYDMTSLPSFEITLTEACRSALATTPTEYCEGSLVYRPPTGEPQTFPQVGVRLKGSASFQPLDGKAAFKIKVDEYVEGTRFFKARRLTLNNMVQDPSMAHELLAYRVYRAMGLPAPRCNYARVLVDGEVYGLYANVESIDDEFFERRFEPAPGNLYEASYGVDLTAAGMSMLELKTNEDVADTSDLATLIDVVNSETFFRDTALGPDWDEVLALGAAEYVIADWDGYFGGTNNYFVYHELTTDRFLMLPWGTDQTFGAAADYGDDPLGHAEYAIDHSTSNRETGVLFDYCWANDACRASYLAHVEAALEVWNALPLSDDLEAALALTADARAEDPRRPYDDATMDSFVAGLRTFLANRANTVQEQLAAAR